MKKYYLIFTILFAIVTNYLHAQNDTVIITELAAAKSALIFPHTKLVELNILYPIWRTYSIHDSHGDYYLLLTEGMDLIDENNKSISSKIKAIKINLKDGVFTKEWEINDAILSEKNYQEYSIWFWTKYCLIKDIDNDKNTDLIIVYGTSGINDYLDGRIKIIIVYNGEKIAIRHQNSISDYSRETQIDASFYNLPISIQNNVIGLIKKLIFDNQAILSNNWEEAINKKKLKITNK